MICSKCGVQVSDGSAFCNTCGNQMAVVVDKPDQEQNKFGLYSLPKELEGTLPFRQKEGMVWYGTAQRRRIEGARNNQQTIFDPGYIVISNQRFFFMEGSRGLFSGKSYSAKETIPYENFTSANVRKVMFKELLVVSHTNGESSYILGMGMTINGQKATYPLVQWLLNMVAHERIHEIEREKQTPKVQYLLDFSFLKMEMEKGGIVVQTIKCPSCGGGISIPASGNATKCQYCGNMVMAQDVFEKMKGLIGGL